MTQNGLNGAPPSFPNSVSVANSVFLFLTLCRMRCISSVGVIHPAAFACAVETRSGVSVDNSLSKAGFYM
jgi:hypothetical protein